MPAPAQGDRALTVRAEWDGGPILLPAPVYSPHPETVRYDALRTAALNDCLPLTAPFAALHRRDAGSSPSAVVLRSWEQFHRVLYRRDELRADLSAPRQERERMEAEARMHKVWMDTLLGASAPALLPCCQRES